MVGAGNVTLNNSCPSSWETYRLLRGEGKHLKQIFKSGSWGSS